MFPKGGMLLEQEVILLPAWLQSLPAEQVCSTRVEMGMEMRLFSRHNSSLNT